MLVALRAPLRLPTAQPARDNVFGFLAKRFTPHTVFMEIGGAGYELALRAAGYVERVYAIDVSGQLLKDVLVPCNVRLVLCDGVRIPVLRRHADGSELDWPFDAARLAAFLRPA